MTNETGRLPGQTLLVVEDERDIREVLALYLQQAGYRVLGAANGAEALRLAAEQEPDLALVDIMLPDLDGLQLCRLLRERYAALPVIFMSARRESNDLLQGFEAGADDYIVKPFDSKVVVAKVQAYFRRWQQSGAAHTPPDQYLWKDERLAIHQDSLEVYVNGEPVSLYAKERQLLLFLVQSPKQVFSVHQLFEEIWGWDRTSDERTVMVHISNLRKKIEADPANPRYIVTVKGFGYRFDGAGE